MTSKLTEGGMPTDIHQWIEDNAECDMEDDATLWIRGAKALYHYLRSNRAWDSMRLIGRVRDRFKELIEKGWDWRSFYNGWLEGRSGMLGELHDEYDDKHQSIASPTPSIVPEGEKEPEAAIIQRAIQMYVDVAEDQQKFIDKLSAELAAVQQKIKELQEWMNSHL